MIRVPAEIQVRIIRPQPEDAVPRLTVEETVAVETPADPAKKIWSKMLSGGGIGILLGIGIYLALNICGVNFGSFETTFILGIPCFLGIMASYVIF